MGWYHHYTDRYHSVLAEPFRNDDSIRKSVTSTVAAILGMIPEGLYLLTTIALALSTMNLAKRKVLLHDMKSIETLARVDVLCVDKTGTITEPVMSIKDVFLSKDSRNPLKTTDELKGLLIDYTAASQDNNATMEALKNMPMRQTVVSETQSTA